MAKKMGGFKVCPKCNTKNGTRAKRCKNESCNHVFEAKRAAASPTDWNQQLEALRQAMLARKTEIGETILALKQEEKEINARLDKLNG